MCNFFKKVKKFQTLDKILNIKLASILKIKNTERISNPFALKCYKNVSMFSSCKKGFLKMASP